MARKTTRRRLTESFVSSLAPARGKARAVVFDTVSTGLCVRVSDTGSTSYHVMSRSPDGRQVWAAIKDSDHVPVTSLRLARELAPTGRDNIKHGKAAYPKAKAESGVMTYGRAVAAYIDGPAKLKQRRWKETQRVLNAVPWADRPLVEITSADAQQHIAALVAAGTPASARITLSWLKALWKWAWRQTLVEHPIMDRLLPDDFGIVSTPRTRFYSDAEIKALWNATGRLSDQQRRFIKLLILLGTRKSALAGMRKSELSVPDHLGRPSVFVVPTSRIKTTKKREEDGRVYVIPLSPLARRVLTPLLDGDTDLLFPSRIKDGAPASIGTQFQRKVRVASGVADWFPHAHRDTIATWLQGKGYDLYDRGLILNHSGSGTVTGGYSHGFSLDRTRALLDEWSDHVSGIVAAKGVELLA